MYVTALNLAIEILSNLKLLFVQPRHSVRCPSSRWLIRTKLNAVLSSHSVQQRAFFSEKIWCEYCHSLFD